VERCRREHDLTIKLNTAVTPESLKTENFDVLIICSGAKPVRLDVEGVDLPHVVQAVDLFQHPEWATDAEDVIVVGGGTVGCEAAYWLSTEYGKRVSIVEMSPSFMKGACTANRGHMIHSLERHGAKLFNCTRLKSIRTGEVTIARNVSSTVPDPFVTWTPLLPGNIANPLEKPIREEIVEETLPADLVVLAGGLRADHSLFETCQAQHTAGEMFYIGDNFHIGNVFEAVHAGFRIGSTL
jgi:2-enoate reductase